MNRKKQAGETLIELLLSLLVISLGLSLFASAVTITQKLHRKKEAALAGYYSDRNILHAGEAETEAVLILEENGVRTNLAVPSVFFNGTYPLKLFSGNGSCKELYRYQKSSPAEAEEKRDETKQHQNGDFS